MGGAEVVAVNLDDGTQLLVRAERFDSSGPSDVGLRKLLSFSQVKASVRGIAKELHEAVESAKPDVVTVELGFELAVKGSALLAVIADAESNASIRVRLEWHNSGDMQAALPEAPGSS